MTFGDLKPGRYYALGTVSNQVFIAGKEPCTCTHYMDTSCRSYYMDDRWSGYSPTDIREATDEEIRHLDACIAAGRYVAAPAKRKEVDYAVW